MNRCIDLRVFLVTGLFSLSVTACRPLAGTSHAAATHRSGTTAAATTVSTSADFSTPTRLWLTPFNPSALQTGQVVSLDDKNIHIYAENGLVTLKVSTSIVIWDGITWIADIPPRAGDEIIAWGTWNPDHTFAVQKLYVNIENLRGKASNVIKGNQGGSFDVADQYQKNEHITVSSLTEISQGNTQFSYQQNPVLPLNGEYVEIIGRRMQNGFVLAVRLTTP